MSKHQVKRGTRAWDYMCHLAAGHINEVTAAFDGEEHTMEVLINGVSVDVTEFFDALDGLRVKVIDPHGVRSMVMDALEEIDDAENALDEVRQTLRAIMEFKS